MATHTYMFDDIHFDWITCEHNRVAVRVREVILSLDGNLSHISRYVKDVLPEYRFLWSENKVGRPSWYVYEPGVYQLIFSSSLSRVTTPGKIQRFQKWVFEGVLPSIRQEGWYVSPDATLEQLESLRTQIDSQQMMILEMARKLQERDTQIADWETDFKNDVAGNPVAFLRYLKSSKSELEKELENERQKRRLLTGAIETRLQALKPSTKTHSELKNLLTHSKD